MCADHLAGTWMGWTGAAGCEVTLPLLQCWQLLTHLAMSNLIPCHMTLAVINPRVALVPRWPSPWMAVKTNGCIESTGYLITVIVSGQVIYLAAMVRKSMRP
jgi:hypothetical protein